MSRIIRGLMSTYRVSDEVLNQGGVGSIHRTDNPSFVYKHYFDPDKAPRRDHLKRLLAVGRDVLLSQKQQPGDTPESSVNWPIDVVPAVGEGVQGVVLPIIPEAFFNRDFGNVRTLDFLVMARAKPPQAKGRVAVLIRMAEILAFIDAQRLVHGDVNGKNLAWAISPKPTMYLIDCDGMLPQSPRPQSGVQALGWTDPRVLDQCIPTHDHLSDRYALALAMYRGLLLTPGKLDVKTIDGRWPEPGKIPHEFPGELATLLRRGLSALDGEARPSPHEWVDALVATYLPNKRFAERALDGLDAMSGTTHAAYEPKRKFHDIPPLDDTPKPLVPPQRQPPPPPNPTPPPYPPPRYSPPQYGYGPPILKDPYARIRELLRPTIRPGARIAQHALRGRFAWYLIGLVASLVVPLPAIVYIGIALFQLRNVMPGHPGLMRVRISLVCFGVLSVLMLILLDFF